MVISLLALVGIVIFSWPSKKPQVIFCNVGQGDGAIVVDGNFQMLIDVGPDNNKMSECLGRYLPFWDKRIEVVVLTHLDSDHSGGLKRLEKYYNVQKIYSGNLAKNDVFESNKIRFEVVSPDQNWGNDNDNSVVGLLSFSDKKILMMGDVSSEVEQKLVWRGVLQSRINIVKISHHGSAVATSEELLMATRPQEAVISVGKRNRFGHPTKVVLDRLDKFGVKVKRTDISGDVLYL